MSERWASSIVLDHETLRLISDIDVFRGRWEMIGSTMPEQLSTLRHAAIIESIASSTRIEGSTLSNEDVKRLLSGLSTKSFASRDEQEVLGYSEALNLILSTPDAIPLTEASIRSLHELMLTQSMKDRWHAGQYKTAPNSVIARDAFGQQVGVIFQPSSPADTPMHMHELLEWMELERKKGELHPLLMIGVFVVVFLEIHPFQDGNGRLSRLLTNLLLFQNGYTYVAYSSLESIVEESKREYYLSLRETQATIRGDRPNWTPWLHYFLRALHRQVTRLEFKLARTPVISGESGTVPEQVLSYLLTTGIASIGDMQDALDVNRNTLKSHLRRMVHDGKIELTGAGRSSRYRLAGRPDR